MVRALVLVLALLTAVAASGQSRHTENTLRLDSGAPRPAATLDDIAWLAGSWEGEAFGGRFEDVWSVPSASSMMGMFKVIEQGTPSFYELQLIVEDEGSLLWKVKHFSADFTAWEEPGEWSSFPLVEIAGDTAYFSGLTVRRVSRDELSVFLAMERPNGPEEVVMKYRRTGAPEIAEGGR